MVCKSAILPFNLHIGFIRIWNIDIRFCFSSSCHHKRIVVHFRVTEACAAQGLGVFTSIERMALCFDIYITCDIKSWSASSKILVRLFMPERSYYVTGKHIPFE